MYENPPTKVLKQPSLYPPLAFHVIRISELLSSIIVLSILSYFVHYLHLEAFSVPWTFILVRIPAPPPLYIISRSSCVTLTLSSATAPYCIRPNYLLSYRDWNPA